MADTGILDKPKVAVIVGTPSMYKVLLHNDDKTTFDFVIKVLTTIFHRTLEDAVALTTEIHHGGMCIAGAPYTREIAEAKTHEVIGFARANNFPLMATFEAL